MHILRAAYNIQDNVDTENRDSGAMEMMPIMNIFNEWHAANTSKKIRAVWKAKAKEGVFHGKKATYGYIKGTDEKRTFIINEETAPIVRRIFEMYASGISPRRISEILNEENVPCPGQYAFEKLGHKGKPGDSRLWGQITIASMLKNIVYIGHMPQLIPRPYRIRTTRDLKKTKANGLSFTIRIRLLHFAYKYNHTRQRDLYR